MNSKQRAMQFLCKLGAVLLNSIMVSLSTSQVSWFQANWAQVVRKWNYWSIITHAIAGPLIHPKELLMHQTSKWERAMGREEKATILLLRYKLFICMGQTSFVKKFNDAAVWGWRGMTDLTQCTVHALTFDAKLQNLDILECNFCSSPM